MVRHLLGFPGSLVTEMPLRSADTFAFTMLVVLVRNLLIISRMTCVYQEGQTVIEAGG